MIISPSILSANYANLSNDIEMINNSQADWFHVDIMDGVFVPNISIGFTVLDSVKKLFKKPLDVHLMIVNPCKFLPELKSIGTSLMTIHYEACTHLHRNVQQIRQSGMKVGVALNPHTPVELLKDILADIDMVVLMSVNPGFGGQKFIPNTLNKVRTLKEMIQHCSPHVLIEVDGGVNAETAPRLRDAGADVLVAGNFVFRSQNPTEPINWLKSL